jgi:hypothetical protein
MRRNRLDADERTLMRAAFIVICVKKTESGGNCAR